MLITCSLERDNKIESAGRYLTDSGRDYARVLFTIRHADFTFVRVRREILNYTRIVIGIQEQFVSRLDGCDSLIIAIAA